MGGVPSGVGEGLRALPVRLDLDLEIPPTKKKATVGRASPDTDPPGTGSPSQSVTRSLGHSVTPSSLFSLASVSSVVEKVRCFQRRPCLAGTVMVH